MTEKKEEIKKKLRFVFLWIAIAFASGAILLLSAWYFRSLISGAIGIALVAFGAYILKRIIRRIPFPESWVIDRGGALISKGPGYHFIIPFFGYDKIYKTVKANIQYHIPLFSDVKGLSIDLKKGGEIMLHDPRIWVLVENPVQAVRKAVNFEEQIREIVENRLTGALNNMTYEEIIGIRIPKLLKVAKKEGKEAIKTAVKKKIDEIIEESEGLKRFLEETGVVYKGFTLDDFDFDESTTTKRRQRILAEMDVQIAKNISEAQKNEMSVIAKTAETLEKSGFSKKLAQKIGSERYQDRLVGEKGRLQKIIWPEGAGTIAGIAAQWELGKKVLSEGAPMGRGKEGEERPRERPRRRVSKEEAERALKESIKETLG